MRAQQFLWVWMLAVLLLISSGLSSCGPGGGAPSTVAPAPASTLARPPRVEEPPVSVVYTRTTIVKDRVIRPYWLEVRSVPRSQAPTEEGFFGAVEDVVGMKSVDDVPQGVAVLKKFVVVPGEISLADLVSPGMVAMSVPTNAVTAMPFLAQNDRVDVIATLGLTEPDSRTPRTETQILVRNVRVLAVHRTFDPGPYAKKVSTDANEAAKEANATIRNPYEGRAEIRSVTLEVSPQIAQKLALAMDLTRELRLAACSESGDAQQPGDVRVSDALFAADEGLDKPVAAAPAAPTGPPREITLIFGRTHQRQNWSPQILAAPYDEDADAPLTQDGVPTGVREHGPTASLPPPDADLLAPLEAVDDTDITLPSLPELPE